MGGFASSIQQPQTGGQSNGKMGSVGQQPSAPDQPQYQAPQPMGKGGAQTNSATSGQPTMGAPNQYPNTIGVGDNSQQQTQRPMQGKGKGA